MLICVFILSFIVNPLDLIWHGFQTPNWLNYRYSFMVCFLLLVMAHRVFENIDQVGYKPVIVSSAVIAAILMVLQKLEYENLPDLEAVWASLAFIAVYLLMMRPVTSPRLPIKNTAVLILTIFVGFEMYASAFGNLIALDEDVVYTTRTTYRTHMDTYRPAFDALQKMDTSFYRSEKVVYKRNNDNLAQGVFGLSNSTSTLNADTIAFLNDLGLASESHWSKYLGSTPPTDTLLGIKYLIGQARGSLPEYYNEVTTVNGNDEARTVLRIFENPYAMSVAFGADSAIKDVDLFGEEEEQARGIIDTAKKVVSDLFGIEFEDEKEAAIADKIGEMENSEAGPDFTNPFDRLDGIYGALLGDDTVDMFVNLNQTAPVVNNLTRTTTSGHTKYTPQDESMGSFITWDITAKTDDVIYMYIPSTYKRECKLSVNSISKGTYFGNETHRIVELGSFAPGTKVTVKLELNKENLYISDEDDNYFYYFDESEYLKVAPRLKGSEFNITEWSEDTLIGNINVAADDTTIFTTIPYDKGWKVECDGKAVETYEVLDSLIAFDLAPGSHELTMKYRPACAVYGSMISIAGIVIFALVCAAEFVWKRKKAAAVPVPDEAAFDSDDAAEDIADEADTVADENPEEDDVIDEDEEDTAEVEENEEE